MNANTQELQLVETAKPDSSNALAPLPENSPAGMMLAAMSRGASLEQVEKMMDLQERWERREAEKAFRDSFAAFRGENVIIPKTKHVDRGRGGSFDQAEYDEVCRRLSPALSKHGFSFRHDQKFGSRKWMTDGIENDIGWVYVTCYLEHKAGHAETLMLEGPPGDLTVNTPTQNMQTTASYLKRQSLLAITGTSTGGEDDESRMRNRSGKESSDNGDDDPLVKLCNEGRDAAMSGMAALTKWWGALDSKQRSELNGEFPAMRKAAQVADKGVQA